MSDVWKPSQLYATQSLARMMKMTLARPLYPWFAPQSLALLTDEDGQPALLDLFDIISPYFGLQDKRDEDHCLWEHDLQE